MKIFLLPYRCKSFSKRLYKNVLLRFKTLYFERNLRFFRKKIASHPDTTPTLVKIGANDGISGDPISDIILSTPKWQGLLIEPVPSLASRLRQNYPTSRFLIETIATSKSIGEREFFVVAPPVTNNLPPYWEQVGSFNREHLQKEANGAFSPYITSIIVRTEPLKLTLQRLNIKDVTLLHIDTEGFDLQVLESLDLESTRPTMIFIEHKHLSPSERLKLFKLMSENDYKILDCGGDYFGYQH